MIMINICHRSIYAGLNRLSEPLGRQIISRSTGALGHRFVVLSDSRDYSEKLQKLEGRVAKSKKLRKIGVTAGIQRVVRIFSDHGPFKILGAGAATIAALKFAEMNGTIIILGLESMPLLAPFRDIIQGMTPPISQIPLTFSGLSLLVAKYSYYDRGYASVMTDDLEQDSDADLSRELAIRRACLRAQIREALDVFGFGRDNTFFRLFHKSSHRSPDMFNYGEIERKTFHMLRLDFQEPINRHDVARAPDLRSIVKGRPFV